MNKKKNKFYFHLKSLKYGMIKLLNIKKQKKTKISIKINKSFLKTYNLG
jgi:hypothetical protein